MQDDHFHCYAFPPGVTAGPGGSAVRTDTFLRGAKGKPKPDLTFYSLTDGLAALAKKQNAKLAGSAKIESLGQTPGKRELWVLKLGAGLDKKPKQARVLFNGGIHAREWLSVTYTYLLAEWLVTSYPAAKPANAMESIAKDLLDNNHVWLMPMLNPDGHEYSVTTFRMQRTSSPGGDDPVLAAPGAKAKRDPKAEPSVDINRNFATKNWQKVIDGKAGSFDLDPNGDTHPGTKPGTSSEAKLLQQLLDSTDFNVHIDHHTHACTINYPYGDDPGPAQDEARLLTFAGCMQRQINAKAQLLANRTVPMDPDNWELKKKSDFYGAQSLMPGSLVDYSIYASEKRKLKTVSLTMELQPPGENADGTSGFIASESLIPKSFRMLIGTSLALIKNATAASPADADFQPFDVVAP